MSPLFPPEFEDDDENYSEDFSAESTDPSTEQNDRSLFSRFSQLTSIGLLGGLFQNSDGLPSQDGGGLVFSSRRESNEENLDHTIDFSQPTYLEENPGKPKSVIEVYTEQYFKDELNQKLGLTDNQARYACAFFRRADHRKQFLGRINENMIRFFHENPEIIELLLPDRQFTPQDEVYARQKISDVRHLIESDDERRGSALNKFVDVFESEMATKILILMIENFRQYLQSEFAEVEESADTYRYAFGNIVYSYQNLISFSYFVEEKIEDGNFDYEEFARIVSFIKFDELFAWHGLLAHQYCTVTDFLRLSEHENGPLLLQNARVLKLFLKESPEIISAEKLFSSKFLDETELIQFFIARSNAPQTASLTAKELYDLDMLPWAKRLRLLEALLRVRGSAGVRQEEIDLVLFTLYKNGDFKLSTKTLAAKALKDELDACDDFPADNPLLLRNLRNTISKADNLTRDTRIKFVEQLRNIVLSLKEKQNLSTEYVDEELTTEITRLEHRLSPLRWLTPTWGYEVEYTEPMYSNDQKQFHTFLKTKVGMNMGEGNMRDAESLEVSPGPFASAESGIAFWDMWYHGQLIDVHSLYNQTLHWNIALQTETSMATLMRLTHLAGRAYDTSTNRDNTMQHLEQNSYATHTLFIREQTHSQDLTGNNISYYECKDGRVATHQDFRTSLGEVPLLAMAAKAFEEIADAFKYFGDNGSEIRQMAYDMDVEADYVCLKIMTEEDIFKYAQSDYQAKLALVWKQLFDAANQGLNQAGFDEFLQKSVPRSQFKKYARMMRKVFPTNDARYDPESINRTWEGSIIEVDGNEYPNAIAFIRSLTEQKVAEIIDIREEIFEHFEMILREAAQNWENVEHRRELVIELFNVFSWFNGTLTKVVDKSTRDEIDVRPTNMISEEAYQEKEQIVAEMIATFIGADVGENID